MNLFPALLGLTGIVLIGLVGILAVGYLKASQLRHNNNDHLDPEPHERNEP